MKSLLFFALVPTLSLALFACGGDDTTDGPGSSAGGAANSGGASSNGGSGTGGSTDISGVPSDKPVTSLTPAEAQKLCEVMPTMLGGGMCRMSAVMAAGMAAGLDSTLSDADLQAACTKSESDCFAAVAKNTDCSSSGEGAPTECTATVGEVVQCMTDTNAALLAALPACATLTRSSLSSQSPGMPTTNPPASCDVVKTKCPSMATTGGGSVGGASSGFGGDSGFGGEGGVAGELGGW